MQKHEPTKETNRVPELLRWIFFCSLVMSIMGACALVPEKHTVKYSSKPFIKGRIISAESGKPVTYQTLLEDLSSIRVVYIGEQHTNPVHHEIQLSIIRSLFQNYPDTSVGMEMFARPYQTILDQWSRGDLGRKTFLEKTHWYANWKFDYQLYSDILDFIKKNQVKLVALNIPFDLPAKIRVGGIENLFESDKIYLPQSVDTSNPAHRGYLKKIFRMHHGPGMSNFEFFYTAQCVWEDAMAEAVADHLKERGPNDGNPNRGKMIVLTGNGHIIHKFGIPDRAFKRTGASFRTIYLGPAPDSADSSIADYLWIPPKNSTY
jgi:uncharacterized iron-regulated protein